jgi:hypothetical protein
MKILKRMLSINSLRYYFFFIIIYRIYLYYDAICPRKDS